MTGMDERLAKVAEVLAGHRLHASMNICTGCDWRATSGTGSLVDQHEAHRVAMTAPHLAEWQAEDEARVLRRFADTLGVNVGDEDGEWWRGYRQGQREAAQAAIRAALDAGRAET